MNTECQHLEFKAQVEVARVTDGESGPVGHFIADVRVTCTECGQHFSFVGLPAGHTFAGPSTDITGCRLSAPMQPWDGSLATHFVYVMPTKHQA